VRLDTGENRRLEVETVAQARVVGAPSTAGEESAFRLRYIHIAFDFCECAQPERVVAGLINAAAFGLEHYAVVEVKSKDGSALHELIDLRTRPPKVVSREGADGSHVSMPIRPAMSPLSRTAAPNIKGCVSFARATAPK
jgi:hypothetical protein